MVGAAREAKQRLDDKFRSQRVSENTRYIKTHDFVFYDVKNSDLINFLSS